MTGAPSTDALVDTLADALFAAFETGTAIEPPSSEHPELDVDTAYKVQRGVLERHAAQGRTVVGAKIGLTSKGIQQQLGVDSPDFGAILDSHSFASGDTIGIAANRMLFPRIEAELAFVLDRELNGPGVTADDVLAATREIVPVFEVIDSRVADWRIKLVDTIADNASCFGVVAAGAAVPLADAGDLAAVEMRIEHDGAEKLTGTGAAVLGHPAEAVAWLANALGAFGESLAPDQLILSGSFGPAIDLEPGRFEAIFSGDLPSVVVNVEG